MASIAVDYDNTYTTDPIFWHQFMCDAEEVGNEVFIVTYRNEFLDKDDRLDFIEQDGFNVYYTRGVAKKWWCEHFGPGVVDIWIDDSPKSIYENSPTTPEELVEFRAQGN